MTDTACPIYRVRSRRLLGRRPIPSFARGPRIGNLRLSGIIRLKPLRKVLRDRHDRANPVLWARHGFYYSSSRLQRCTFDPRLHRRRPCTCVVTLKSDISMFYSIGVIRQYVQMEPGPLSRPLCLHSGGIIDRCRCVASRRVSLFRQLRSHKYPTNPAQYPRRKHCQKWGSPYCIGPTRQNEAASDIRPHSIAYFDISFGRPMSLVREKVCSAQKDPAAYHRAGLRRNVAHCAERDSAPFLTDVW